MEGVGIFDRDLLIIDRSLEPRNGDVVVAAIDGELTCKLLDTKHQVLKAANPKYPPIAIGDEMELLIEGVIMASIRYHRHPICSP